MPNWLQALSTDLHWWMMIVTREHFIGGTYSTSGTHNVPCYLENLCDQGSFQSMPPDSFLTRLL